MVVYTDHCLHVDCTHCTQANNFPMFSFPYRQSCRVIVPLSLSLPPRSLSPRSLSPHSLSPHSLSPSLPVSLLGFFYVNSPFFLCLPLSVCLCIFLRLIVRFSVPSLNFSLSLSIGLGLFFLPLSIFVCVSVTESLFLSVSVYLYKPLHLSSHLSV